MVCVYRCCLGCLNSVASFFIILCCLFGIAMLIVVWLLLVGLLLRLLLGLYLVVISFRYIWIGLDIWVLFVGLFDFIGLCCWFVVAWFVIVELLVEWKLFCIWLIVLVMSVLLCYWWTDLVNSVMWCGLFLLVFGGSACVY